MADSAAVAGANPVVFFDLTLGGELLHTFSPGLYFLEIAPEHQEAILIRHMIR